MTHRLNALLHGDSNYSTAVSDFLDDAIDRSNDAKRWKQDDIDEALRLLARDAILLTAGRKGKGQGRVRDDRDIGAT